MNDANIYSQTPDSEVVWSENCLSVIARGGQAGQHGLSVVLYEVELEGGEVLYRSESYYAVQHFLRMLTEPHMGRFVA